MIKKIVLVITIILLLVGFGTLIYFYTLYQRSYVGDKGIQTPVPTAIKPTPTPDPLAPKNVLLLGYAGPGHEGPTLTDTIIVAHVEPREKRVSLISIQRDIWVSIPIKGDQEKNFKLNQLRASTC